MVLEMVYRAYFDEKIGQTVYKKVFYFLLKCMRLKLQMMQIFIQA